MKRTYFSVIFIGLFNLSVLFVDCQFFQTQSPCPGIFDYQSDGVSVYGVIRLQSNGPVSSVHLRANFTVAARLLSNYLGKIEPIGDSQILQRFNRGEPLTYRVQFPVTSPLPRLTSIVANANTLCYGPGDIPGPTQYVTMINLEHMLLMKGGSPSIGNSQYEPQPKPDPGFEFIGDFGNNAQIFTFNDIDKDSWDSNNVNYTGPTLVQSPILSPSRPQPGYYDPDETTQKPRPLFILPPPSAPPLQQIPAEIPTPPPKPAPPRLPEISASPAAVECGVIAGGNERVPLIFNGQSYSRGDWPWLVALYRRKEGSLSFICSGTLVSDRHVVTAAHCMQQKTKLSTTKDIVVKIGVYNLEDWGDDISVTRTLTSASIHESYNAATLENDVLVVTFEKKVEFNTYIRPACLWNGDTDLSRIVGASGVVAGWGTSEIGPSGQGEPRMVRIPVVSTSTCKASRPEFHKLTSANTLCAGDRKGSGPCTGDSGGGLYILDGGRWRLRGVVSLSLRPQNGENTCDLNEYIVFTDTAQYLKWIRGVITQNLFDK